VGTKAGIKGASVTMGYLETGMRVLDSASALLSRLQELAVLGANGTNTVADGEAINLEAEAIADEFNRLMTTSTYKGRDLFNSTANSLYVSMGGRDQEMSFGIGKITYTDLYDTERTIQNAISNDTKVHTTAVAGPNQGAKFNIAHLPSDAVTAKDYGKMVVQTARTGGFRTKDDDMEANKTYVIQAKLKDGAPNQADKYDAAGIAKTIFDTAGVEIYRASDTTDTKVTAAGELNQVGDVIVVGANAIAKASFTNNDPFTYKEVNTGPHALKAGDSYVIASLGSGGGSVTTAGTNDASAIARAVTGISNGDTLVVGQRFTIDKNLSKAQLAHINSLSGGMTLTAATDTLTKDIEAIQALVNTARVQAGSQYAAMESAVNYTTDLTAQYELGYNTVNDVNFSMETAHLAKNQILQQAATAMLAQANSGQQGLLQLIS
jgi:flagellin